MKRKELESKVGLLEAELLTLRYELRKKDLIGYRAVERGDEYEYGQYTNYLFKDYGRTDAQRLATETVKESVNGGYVEDILKGQEKEEGYFNMSKTVFDYQQEINEAQAKIWQIQDSCQHPNWKLQMYSWRPGAMQPQRICNDCLKLVSGITEEEQQKVWDEWNRPMRELEEEMKARGYDVVTNTFKGKAE